MTNNKNNHRIVFDPNKDLLHFAGYKQSQNDGTLNKEGAKIFIGLGDIADDPEKLRAYYAQNKSFLDECFENGWIDEDLQINGTIKTAEGAHHLKSVQFELLLKCNLSCGYCYCSAGQDRQEIMSKDDIMAALDDCERLGVLAVDFTGGEFLLYPHWKEIMQHARDLGLAISLHTNGMALTQRNVDFIDEIGVCMVQVSADGHTAELHNSTRGHPRAFQMMTEGMERMHEKNMPFRVNIMVHEKTKDHVTDIVRHFHAKGYNVNFDWISPFGSEVSNGLGISVKDYFEAVAPLRNPNDLIETPTPCGRDLGYQHNDYEPSCGVGYSYLFITATGEIAICPTLTSREDPILFDSPNLKEISLYEAWTGHEYYDKHRFVNCKNVEVCPAGTSCRGGCRANAFAQAAGKLDAPNMIECNNRKNQTNKYVDFDARYAAGNYEIVKRKPAIK